MTNCTLPSAVDTARAHCNGHNKCELTAKSGVWKANPCIGVIKYVEVKYICNEVGPTGKNYKLIYIYILISIVLRRIACSQYCKQTICTFYSHCISLYILLVKLN